MNPRAAVNGSGRYSASEKGPRARRLRLALDKSGSAIPGAEGARAKGETHPGDFADRKNHAAPAGVINPALRQPSHCCPLGLRAPKWQVVPSKVDISVGLSHFWLRTCACDARRIISRKPDAMNPPPCALCAPIFPAGSIARQNSPGGRV